MSALQSNEFSEYQAEELLTHCRLNELYILEDSNFSFRYVRLCDLDIPREKWFNYLQTVETLMADGLCNITLQGISRLHWMKEDYSTNAGLIFHISHKKHIL